MVAYRSARYSAKCKCASPISRLSRASNFLIIHCSLSAGIHERPDFPFHSGPIYFQFTNSCFLLTGPAISPVDCFSFDVIRLRIRHAPLADAHSAWSYGRDGSHFLESRAVVITIFVSLSLFLAPQHPPFSRRVPAPQCLRRPYLLPTR